MSSISTGFKAFDPMWGQLSLEDSLLPGGQEHLARTSSKLLQLGTYLLMLDILLCGTNGNSQKH
jgi:hypothetical protein